MLLFQLLMTHKTPPACLSSRTPFCSYSHSSCFSHTRLLRAPRTHPAPFYIRAFAVFLSLCNAFQSYLLLADFFWSLSSQLNVTNPAKTPTSPHHHRLSSCPVFRAALCSLSSPFRIPIMCFVELCSVFYIALLFFSHFFPQSYTMYLFSFLLEFCLFHVHFTIEALCQSCQMLQLSCQSLRAVVGSE